MGAVVGAFVGMVVILTVILMVLVGDGSDGPGGDPDGPGVLGGHECMTQATESEKIDPERMMDAKMRPISWVSEKQCRRPLDVAPP